MINCGHKRLPEDQWSNLCKLHLLVAKHCQRLVDGVVCNTKGCKQKHSRHHKLCVSCRDGDNRRTIMETSEWDEQKINDAAQEIVEKYSQITRDNPKNGIYE